MTNVLISALKLAIMLLPILFLCCRNNSANIQRSLRAKQFIMPVIAVIFAILVMALSPKLSEWVYTAIMAIPVLLYQLGAMLGLGGALTPVAAALLAFLNSLNWEIWLAYAVCFIAFWAYIILKRVCVGIIKRVNRKNPELGHSIYSNFYDKSRDGEGFCIQEKFIDTRKFFKTLYYAGVAISCVFMVVSGLLVLRDDMSNLFYPIYAMILLGEVYYYLNGFSVREYNSEVLGEDEDASAVANYSLLRNVLRKIFAGKVIDEGTSINHEYEYGITNEEIINELEKDADPVVNTFAKFYKNKLGGDFELDRNYLYSSLDLLKGKSVLFNNPFYNDLVPYAFYPMNRKLLEHKKVLVVLGRQGIENDVKEWLEDGIESVTGMPYFWEIGVLGDDEFDGDIAILPRSEVTNIDIQEKNAQFLHDVEFVVILEPSKLITTAQIGLNMLVKKCRGDNSEKKITFCISDKNSDGLVDAISHILMTSFEEVSATNKHKGSVSHMCWRIDDEYLQHRIVPNISRYLGIGTELSFAALKCQINRAKWYGGETFPVVDMSWIAKQYYYDLLKYADLPTEQKMMDRKFITSANYWGASTEENAYLTVEDENFNIFEALRDFSTRTTSQGFVNIISPQYLLRDYMADNASMFEADAKAIPSIAADYAKTVRNTTLGMLLQISSRSASEEMLKKEFSLLGIEVFDIKKQIWFEIFKCFSGVEVINTLPENYKDAVEAVRRMKINAGGEEFGINILTAEEEYNYVKGIYEVVYRIEDKNFIKNFVGDLKSASYVAEDEMDSSNYLGSELICQIYQRILPGQFLTLAGKYYEMSHLSSENEIVVRRAADHIDNRYSYRQIRNYSISGLKKSNIIGKDKTVDGMHISKEYADISVETPGYYKVLQNNDFAHAAKILYEEGSAGIPNRSYMNKPVLRIKLPNSEMVDEKIRYTITLLINEVFQSLFAENQPYIAAVSAFGESADRDPLTYSLTGSCPNFDPESIYIIEDSQLDLGLIEAVERNLNRIFEIICDYLDWHEEALEKSRHPAREVEEPQYTEFGGPEKLEKEGLIAKIKRFIKKIFKIGDKEADGADAETGAVPEGAEVPEGEIPETETETETPDSEVAEGEAEDSEEAEAEAEDEDSEAEAETEESETEEPETEAEEQETEPEEPEDSEAEPENEEQPAEAEDEPEIKASTMVMLDAVEGAEGDPEPDEDDEVTFEPAQAMKGGIKRELPYHERYFTLYGFDEQPEKIDTVATKEYLIACGFQGGSLKQAREGKNIAEIVAYSSSEEDGARICDFCGREIMGVEFETLIDGRERCTECSRTAIKTEKEFKDIYAEVKRNMESFYGIRINAGIKVQMVNSKRLHKKIRRRFIPTRGQDPRVIGVAIKDKNGFSLLIENGAPRMQSMMTIAHELTHIWQYKNWDAKQIRAKYGEKLELEIYEGMAKWAEIQYAYLLNEATTARLEEYSTMRRDDEYGRGFARYAANYKITHESVITGATPFMNTEEPLSMEFCGDTMMEGNDRSEDE